MSDSPSVRDQAIIDLIRLYRDLEGTSSSGTGGREGDDRMLYMDGGQWDTSGCDTLDTLLVRMRGERPSQWWHLTERYLRCESRSKRVKVDKRGRLEKLGPYCEALGHGVRPPDLLRGGEVLVVVESWQPAVRPQKVRLAVRWLVVEFPWDRFRWNDLRTSIAA